MDRPVVGILGGMGPEATVDLMRRVIALTPARDDADHVRMLVDNNPQVPSRVAALLDGDGESPAPTLIAMARGLQAQGADFLVMPCNTAHHYHGDVAAAVDVPFLNLMELVARHLAGLRPSVSRVGLLASSVLARIRLYEPWLEAEGMSLLYPDAARQEALMAQICAVKAGDYTTHADALRLAAAQLRDAGADVLLVACTELSVVADRDAAGTAMFDAADILARAVVARSAG